MIKKVYVRAERFHPFSNFEGIYYQLENFKRMKKEIKIPAIAENVETGLIAGVLVSVGDKISKDQSVVEIETDKATTDIPSPFEGVVDEIKVEEGDEVKIDQVIMIIETEGTEEEKGEGKEEKKEEDSEPEEQTEKKENKGQ